MVVQSDAQYQAAAEQLWKGYHERYEAIEDTYAACLTSCNGDPACELKCLGPRLKKHDDINRACRLSVDAIDADAVKYYLHLPPRIIVDWPYVDLAETLHGGLFSPATVVVVTTAQELKSQLGSDRKVGFLIVV